jgi:hypothetical protein
MDKKDEKNLKKRYLSWLYKNTKESFDRYERKFTQLDIDKFILREMEKEIMGSYLPEEKKALEKSVNGFREYISRKEESGFKLKYKGKKINPEFIFLDVKLMAIEKAIAGEFGEKGLAEIKESYEKEMARRILEEKEPKK